MARMIGHRIRSLIYGDPETGEGPLYIANEAFDRNREEGPENPKRRPLEFRDITILQRSVRNCGGMIREYERMGILHAVNGRSVARRHSLLQPLQERGEEPRRTLQPVYLQSPSGTEIAEKTQN